MFGVWVITQCGSNDLWRMDWCGDDLEGGRLPWKQRLGPYCLCLLQTCVNSGSLHWLIFNAALGYFWVIQHIDICRSTRDHHHSNNTSAFLTSVLVQQIVSAPVMTAMRMMMVCGGGGGGGGLWISFLQPDALPGGKMAEERKGGEWGGCAGGQGGVGGLWGPAWLRGACGWWCCSGVSVTWNTYKWWLLLASLEKKHF